MPHTARPTSTSIGFTMNYSNTGAADLDHDPITSGRTVLSGTIPQLTNAPSAYQAGPSIDTGVDWCQNATTLGNAPSFSQVGLSTNTGVDWGHNAATLGNAPSFYPVGPSIDASVNWGHNLIASESVMQPTASASSASNTWTREEDTFLIEHKMQNFTLSKIRILMRDKLKVDRNENVLSKRYAKLRGHYKQTMKGSIMEEVCRNITWDISRVVAQRLWGEGSHSNNELVAEVQKKVAQKLPGFLGDLTADLHLSA